MDAQPETMITPQEILAARAAIDPVFLDSPAMRHGALDAALGCAVTLKVESLNPVRSFKGRGTEALLASLDPLPASVVATSSGNFGQGLARAAARRGVAATILAPSWANPLKLDAMRRLGATVRLADPADGAGKDLARRIAAETGALFVEDGGHRIITAGAGVIGQELTAGGHEVDDVIVQIGDGALATGIGCWFKAQGRSASPGVRIIGVVARGAPAMAQSFAAGRAIDTPHVDTIADGMAIARPVSSAVAQLRACVDEILLVDDDAIVEAARLLLRTAGVLAEPSGAAGLAAVMTHRARFAGRRVAAVVTGSNLDAAFQAKLLVA
ncbi:MULTISPECIES: threonine ammonia-lyase [unclassified Inquilinus]|uniref:threonine ammonia-lyase n=1 Tax=unclassified Inquilinus TaxID=2645927 RepID=UPI003F9051EA